MGQIGLTIKQVQVFVKVGVSGETLLPKALQAHALTASTSDFGLVFVISCLGNGFAAVDFKRSPLS